MESMNEITALFYEQLVFCPDYMATDAMKMSKYCYRLRDEIRECVTTMRCQTLHDMTQVARLCMIELERQMKLKRPTPTQMTNQPNKKLKMSGARGMEIGLI